MAKLSVLIAPLLMFANQARADRVAAPSRHSQLRVQRPAPKIQQPLPQTPRGTTTPAPTATEPDTQTPIPVEANGRLSAESVRRLAKKYKDIFGEPDLPAAHPTETVPSFTGIYSATKPMGSSSVIGAPNFWTPPKAGKPSMPFHDLPDDHFPGLDCNYHPSETDLECMVCNIYYEARNQASKGQIEVGQTVLTRVVSSHYPETICQNVYAFKQFSWTLPSILRSDQRRLPEKLTPTLQRVIQSAREALRSGPNGYDSYYAYSLVNPRWGHLCRPSPEWITFGAHRFCSVHADDLAARNEP